jgi:hypothetical protein
MNGHSASVVKMKEQFADGVAEQVELPARPQPQDALEPSGVEVWLGG